MHDAIIYDMAAKKELITGNERDTWISLRTSRSPVVKVLAKQNAAGT
jgi:hypothetical protein